MNTKTGITKKFVLAFLVMACCSNVLAQDSVQQQKALRYTAYADIYYSYDFNHPSNHTKPAFLYNHNRHNEVNLNLAVLGMQYEKEMFRSNLALMAGTYAQYNLAAEPELLRHVYEANIGVKISKQYHLWIDAGIMPSHIGFESAVNTNNWTLTRSLLAENSPYYETGLRMSYKTSNSKFYSALFYLNGWQRIQRPEGNNTPAFGWQLSFLPSSRLTINSSSFIVNDKPDTVKQWRYFHNFFDTWQPQNSFGVTLGFDIGTEENKARTDRYTWYGLIGVVRYKLHQWSMAARAEYYHDKEGVIVPAVNGQPFQTQAYSVNIDKEVGRNVLWRLEGRWMKNAGPYFEKQSTYTQTATHLTTSFIFSL